jgi:hypothetical protein
MKPIFVCYTGTFSEEHFRHLKNILNKKLKKDYHILIVYDSEINNIKFELFNTNLNNKDFKYLKSELKNK